MFDIIGKRFRFFIISGIVILICIISLSSLGLKAGIEFSNPVMRLATAALPVIPNIKITDLGIVDVVNQRLVDLFDQ